VRQRVELDGDAYTLAADCEGRVYVGTQGQWTKITRLDLRQASPSSTQWPAKLHGRIYLKLAPDQYRLYVGTSSVVSNRLDARLLRGHSWDSPPQVGMAVSDSHGLVRGEFFLTPDGQFLLNRWGKVLRLVQGKIL
jgi:hypothetical protein